MSAQPQQYNFGGLHFPDLSEPPPGPLRILAEQLRRDQETVAAQAPPPQVQRMLADLPMRVQTKALQRQHMPLLEKLAKRWHEHALLLDLVDELLFMKDHRQHGMGFDALVELTELAHHVKATRSRAPSSVWDIAYGLR
jgi:hypothetical protein